MLSVRGSEVRVEEGEDAVPGVEGRRFVIAAVRHTREEDDESVEFGWVMIVQEGMARVGILLDVVGNTDGGQRPVEFGGRSSQ